MKRLLRLSLVFLCLWGALLALGSVVRLSPDWPPWGVAAAAALAVEAILWLYRYEAQAVTPRRARWMIGLRLGALAVLLWILLDPVWVRKSSRERQREVVVLMDDSGSMRLVDEGETLSRREIAEQALDQSRLLEKLRGNFRVRVLRAARSVHEEGGEAAGGWSDATDLAAALATVLEQVAPDDLAGAVLVSDGRHNRPGRVEEPARRFGILDAPIGIVAVGSPRPPRDAAVLSVSAPDAIHLGDRLRVSAEVKIDGYPGTTAAVRLVRGGETLERREISVSGENHREDLGFTLQPEAGGVDGYRVEIEPLEGERFAENNAWEFETSITDARTNVLLVEGFPRWEFRYLRNLFYGRDKSVHLQYVLLHPDRVTGQEDPAVPASASRPFGEARATRLPASEEEWRKFDVIILGDLSPDALDEPTWRIISRCVNERGALLALIAGPRFMPHAIASETGRDLVPAEMEWGRRMLFAADGGPLRFALTTAGADHPVTRQDAGRSANETVWSAFPPIRWRHPIAGLKDGAEVLLTAAEEGAAPEPPASRTGLSEALDALAKRRQREAEAALLVTRQTGKGKVALLLTDRTWRLREGAGDVFHHRFWGNLVRWGAGPTLRSGGERVRLGTDRLVYTPDDRVKLVARLRDGSLAPVTDESLRAEVLRDGAVVVGAPVTAVAGSDGLHEANLGPFREPGSYQVRISGSRADGLIADDGAAGLATSFRVVPSHGPLELADTTLNLPLLETVAALSGGQVVAPYRAGELADLFLTERNGREEIRETSLWDNAWVLGLLGLLLGGEWVARRSAGLP